MGAKMLQLIDLPSNMNSILETPTLAESTAAFSKLICTIGPSSRDVTVLEELLKAGMKVARFDFSYGDSAFHQVSVDNLKEAMISTGLPCAIMYDTIGPEIVVLNRPEEPIKLVAGQTVTLSCNKGLKASSSTLPISWITSFAGTGVELGSAVFIGQYLFSGSDTSSAYMTVQEITTDSLVCLCNNSCTLEGVLLTVHLSGYKNTGSSLSEEDCNNISVWGTRNEIDFVSLAFTRCAADVKECRDMLNRTENSSAMIVAKIESLVGLMKFEEILEAADAIIFSRGNLGMCVDAEKMFLVQKEVLRACNMVGKPVYVTRVVDTMADAPRPTRAEATDVANLVLDGADGILLGSETFRGISPVSTVQTVMAICRQAELCFDSFAFYRSHMDAHGFFQLMPDMEHREALASSAVRASEKMHAKLIVVFTVTGTTARLMSKYKPAASILTVVCTDPKSARYSENANENAAPVPSLQVPVKHNYTFRQCLSYRGVLPIMVPQEMDSSVKTNSAQILDYALEYAMSIGLVADGDKVVVSQCPRSDITDCFDEVGIVKLVTVEAKGMNARSAVVGSFDNLAAV